jgi:LacI family transcriptional regulator
LTRIKDIAEKAGVSVTTVSHVLNKSRYVHPDTEARVLEVIRALDYRPNMLARSLRRHETHTIGLLVSDITNKYFTDVARSVETTAYERGYNMILCNTDEDLAKEEMYFDVLLGKQIDGLIVAPALGDHSFIRSHIERGAYVVFVNRFLTDVQAPAVICDDEEAAYALVDQVISSGHRRIGAIIGLPNASTTMDRLHGLHRAAQKHGLAEDDLWIFPGNSRQEGGYQAAEVLIGMHDRPTCVIGFNSVMLDGFWMGIVDRAPQLIQEIEGTGFGYSHFSRVFHPNGYYVSQPAHQVGATAAKLLLDVITGTADWKTEKITVKNSIVNFQSFINSSVLHTLPVISDGQIIH